MSKEVLELQIALNKRCHQLRVDGVYGVLTASAHSRYDDLDFDGNKKIYPPMDFAARYVRGLPWSCKAKYWV